MKTLLLILLSATAAFGQGTILWDESVNGLLSNNPNTASGLPAFQIGSNSVLAHTESQPFGNNWIVFEDYFTCTVWSGVKVSGLFFSADRPVSIWIGSSDFSSQWGYVVNSTGGNLFAQIGINSIGSGSFGLTVANYDFAPVASTANYRLDFFVQAVPEPGTLSLLLLGAGWVGFRSGRKFRFKAK